jgi:hypothetical protein
VIAIADSVRESCIEAAIRAYEDAGISGLCAEGRWELAIQAMRGLDMNSIASSTLEEMQDQTWHALGVFSATIANCRGRHLNLVTSVRSGLHYCM